MMINLHNFLSVVNEEILIQNILNKIWQLIKYSLLVVT